MRNQRSANECRGMCGRHHDDAPAGTILAAELTARVYATAMITLVAVGLVGLVAAAFLRAPGPQRRFTDADGN